MLNCPLFVLSRYFWIYVILTFHVAYSLQLSLDVSFVSWFWSLQLGLQWPSWISLLHIDTQGHFDGVISRLCDSYVLVSTDDSLTAMELIITAEAGYLVFAISWCWSSIYIKFLRNRAVLRGLDIVTVLRKYLPFHFTRLEWGWCVIWWASSFAHNKVTLATSSLWWELCLIKLHISLGTAKIELDHPMLDCSRTMSSLCWIFAPSRIWL